MTNTDSPPPASPSLPVSQALPLPTTADAHGHNPADYHWVPVLRKRRADGWSPEKQVAFIEALADTGSVAGAARSVGMSEGSAYKLHRSPGAEGFARAWDAAMEASGKKLLAEAFERALVGSDEPVFNREGDRVGRRFRKSDHMLKFLLRGYFPERFGGFASGYAPTDSTANASAAIPVAEAIALMLPEPPADPETLMDLDDLSEALDIADNLDGKLPRWYRDPDLAPGGREPPVHEHLERMLEDSKRANAGESPISDEEWQSHFAALFPDAAALRP